MKNRKGIIKIDNRMIEDGNFDVLKLLFSNFIPLFINKNFFSYTEYGGICEYFDEVKDGEVTPYYDAIITNTGAAEKQELLIDFKRLK